MVEELFYKKILKNLFSDSVQITLWNGETIQYGEGEPQFHITFHKPLSKKEIAKDPFAKHRNVEKLINREGFRLRIGDWRVIYKVDGDTFIILVVKIKPRGDAYK